MSHYRTAFTWHENKYRRQNRSGLWPAASIVNPLGNPPVNPLVHPSRTCLSLRQYGDAATRCCYTEPL